ncbi:MAG: helix-turn-helix domain-containing protein [Chitinivibrionales bacterium]|nr:helix-turn-helix domain-containing protein [Chitinivibrionales bacterium]
MVRTNDNQRALEEHVGAIRNPANYYAGTAPFSLELPRNIILFRRTRAARLGSAPSHHHRFVLIVSVRSEGSVTIDHRSFRLRPGSAILVFPHQFHHFMHIQSPSILWLFVTFEADGHELLRPFRNVPVALTAAARGILDALVAEYLDSRRPPTRASNAVTLRTALLLNELVALASRRSARLAPQRVLSSRFGRVEAVHQFVSGHIGEPFTIADLARHVAVSESHLRALYKRETGMSLGSYVSQMRLNRASGLLLSSAMNVKQVATECGYDSLFSFSRAFKREMGVSPRTYRRMRMGRRVSG